MGGQRHQLEVVAGGPASRHARQHSGTLHVHDVGGQRDLLARLEGGQPAVGARAAAERVAQATAAACRLRVIQLLLGRHRALRAAARAVLAGLLAALANLAVVIRRCLRALEVVLREQVLVVDNLLLVLVIPRQRPHLLARRRLRPLLQRLLDASLPGGLLRRHRDSAVAKRARGLRLLEAAEHERLAQGVLALLGLLHPQLPAGRHGRRQCRQPRSAVEAGGGGHAPHRRIRRAGRRLQRAAVQQGARAGRDADALQASQHLLQRGQRVGRRQRLRHQQQRGGWCHGCFGFRGVG
mmetsp:Transcript_31114/g.79879  ORF Transcript_31114/g.79879 Transcript_31114/m.79879 type:complete len:296 (+) Transcript_31114:138-1025(+)